MFFLELFSRLQVDVGGPWGGIWHKASRREWRSSTTGKGSDGNQEKRAPKKGDTPRSTVEEPYGGEERERGTPSLPQRCPEAPLRDPMESVPQRCELAPLRNAPSKCNLIHYVSILECCLHIGMDSLYWNAFSILKWILYIGMDSLYWNSFSLLKGVISIYWYGRPLS